MTRDIPIYSETAIFDEMRAIRVVVGSHNHDTGLRRRRRRRRPEAPHARSEGCGGRDERRRGLLRHGGDGPLRGLLAVSYG